MFHRFIRRHSNIKFNGRPVNFDDNVTELTKRSIDINRIKLTLFDIEKFLAIQNPSTHNHQPFHKYTTPTSYSFTVLENNKFIIHIGHKKSRRGKGRESIGEGAMKIAYIQLMFDANTFLISEIVETKHARPGQHIMDKELNTASALEIVQHIRNTLTKVGFTSECNIHINFYGSVIRQKSKFERGMMGSPPPEQELQGQLDRTQIPTGYTYDYQQKLMGTLSEIEIQNFAQVIGYSLQILNGLRCATLCRVVTTDIKRANVFYFVSGGKVILRIADFDLWRIIPVRVINPQPLLAKNYKEFCVLFSSFTRMDESRERGISEREKEHLGAANFRTLQAINEQLVELSHDERGEPDIYSVFDRAYEMLESFHN